MPVSPSSRRAWIEISRRRSAPSTPYVALLAEGVDRNTVAVQPLTPSSVALLAEGVDRNYFMNRTTRCMPVVALLAEGVDRNTLPK